MTLLFSSNLYNTVIIIGRWIHSRSTVSSA